MTEQEAEEFMYSIAFLTFEEQVLALVKLGDRIYELGEHRAYQQWCVDNAKNVFGKQPGESAQ